jgi:hypothetical protein
MYSVLQTLPASVNAVAPDQLTSCYLNHCTPHRLVLQQAFDEERGQPAFVVQALPVVTSDNICCW